MDAERNTPLHILIRALRLEAGYTQEEAAKALCISRPAYNGKERGKTPFYPEELLQLSKLYGVKPDVFFSPELWVQEPADLQKIRFELPDLSDVGKLTKEELQIIADYRRRAAGE